MGLTSGKANFGIPKLLNPYICGFRANYKDSIDVYSSSDVELITMTLSTCYIPEANSKKISKMSSAAPKIPEEMSSIDRVNEKKDFGFL